MSDATTLLPSSATKFERDLSESTDALPRVGPAAELIRSAKRDNIPDSVVPWLIVEYGLGELLPYLSDPRTAIATGVLWQRLRGTPESFKIALGWIGNDGQIEESEASTIRWSQFQLGLAQAPVDLSQTDSIVEIGRLSSPVRSSLFRIYGGWYDGRRFTLDDHKLSSLDTLCDHTGVYLKTEWPQLSFGREFKNEDGNIRDDLEGQLGIHRINSKRGLYEDRTYLSNSILGDTPWRTLHIEDLSSCISRLHFSIYGPWWNNATDWDVPHSWDGIFDWAGLQNKFTPALKFARAGMYLSDYAELGDTNACLPCTSLTEFGDGAVLLSEGNPDTGEGILSEHLSRVEYVEINERFDVQTELGSMWVGGGNNQVQVETHQLQHGQAYASTSHPNPPEHATLITSLSHYNGSRNNRHDTSQTVFGDGAGHTLGRGEDFTSLGLTSFEDGDGGSGYPERFDLSTLVIDEVAGTISAVDSNGTTHTRPLFNQDGIRRVTEFRNEYSDNTAQIYIGAPITLLPSLREHTRELAYDDSFELSRSRLSEYTPLINECGISRGHTTSAAQTEEQSDQWQDTESTWATDATGTWETVASYFDTRDFGDTWQTETWETGEYFVNSDTDTWANTYSWTVYPQLEQILGFSRTMLTLSENGHLSDTDGILGNTHATLGFFENERIERSHQTTAVHANSDHKLGLANAWVNVRGTQGWGSFDIGYAVETLQIDEVAQTISVQRVEYRTNFIFTNYFHHQLGTVDTFPLYDASGIRQRVQFGATLTANFNTAASNSGVAGVWGGTYSHDLFIGNPLRLVPSDRERYATLAYYDVFFLSLSILSETIDLSQVTSNTRAHTTGFLQIPPQSGQWELATETWSGPEAWDTETSWFSDTPEDSTWHNRYAWQHFPQLDQVLGFSRSMVTLSENGHLSDNDGILGDTHATLSHFADERIERSHQTTSAAHNPTGVFYHLRERFQTLAYDDLFELSRSRLSEHIPLFNEQSITREHGGELTWPIEQFTTWNDTSPTWNAAGDWQTSGWSDADNEPNWYEGYAWQNFPQVEQVLSFSRAHLTLSDSDAGLDSTNATLGWNTSERFDRDYFAQATENRQSITERLHTRTVQSSVELFVEPTWSDTLWAGPSSVDWNESTDDWQNGSWATIDWVDSSDITWANEPMWARIARWQIASLVVETQHQTHV